MAEEKLQPEQVEQPAPEPEAAYAGSGGDDLNTPMILLVGVIFAVLVFVVIFFLQGLFYRMQHTEQQSKVIAEQPQELGQLRADQQAKLNSYGWIDRQKGVVSIPIDRAMELELKRLRAAQGGAAPPPPGAMPEKDSDAKAQD